MTHTRKLSIGAGIIAAIAVIIFGAYLTGVATKFAQANPSRIQEPVTCSTQGTSATALATTSVTYITPGTATTTITCNMGNAGDGTEVFDAALLNIALTGSSTATQLRWQIFTSQDGIDFYPYLEDVSANATSSNMATQEFALSFASTSPLAAEALGTGNQTIMRRVADIPVKAKYIRVKFYLPIGSFNAALWANVVGISERGY